MTLSSRSGGRGLDSPRPLRFDVNILKFAQGSCLAVCGNTQVLCAVTLEDRVPPFLRGKGSGWLAAEYGLLPCSTPSRVEREAVKGKQSGRTQEIQRLIARALRPALDLKILGEWSIKVDCDVLQADGGTRTTAISGAYIALHQALSKALPRFGGRNPLRIPIAAISCGIVDGKVMADLDYEEDSRAEVDANFIMTHEGFWVEVQLTGEKRAISSEELLALQTCAHNALRGVIAKQREALRL